jgi:hypothetical protein
MTSSKLNGTIDELEHREEWTTEERAQIIDEANRILADPAFKNSKRCLALFRRLVDRSLAGDHDSVKERTLGHEVFGRPPDYDTAMDPVVRMTAVEIRKRLAQWYDEPTHHQQVRMRLTAGSYLLKFEFVQPGFVPETLEAKTEVKAPGPAVLPEVETETGHQADTQPGPESNSQAEVIAPSLATEVRLRNKWIWGAAAIVFVALAVVLTLRYFDVFQSRQYLAWKPLLNSAEPLTLSIPEQPPQVIADGPLQWQLIADLIANRVVPGGTAAQNADTVTPVAIAVVSQTITKWLTLHGKESILRGSSAMNMRDFRQGPVVLVGGFNPWSLVLISNLRYSIRVDPATHAMWIQDAQNASKRDWMIDGNGQPKNVDYAVISRFIDPETRHWVLSLGGMRKQGTRAARDLLIDSSFAKLLPAQISSKGNFQIVLKTNLVNGSVGPPQVIAAYTW